MIDEDALALEHFVAPQKRAREDQVGDVPPRPPPQRRRLDSSDDDDDEDGDDGDDDDDDASPLRRSSATNNSNDDDDSDSDAAPRRRGAGDSDDGDSDSDASPPRRGASSSSSSSLSGLMSGSDFQKSHDLKKKEKAKELARIEAAAQRSSSSQQDGDKIIHRDGSGNVIDFKAAQAERQRLKKREERLWTTGKAQRDKLLDEFEHRQAMASAPFAQYSDNTGSSRDNHLRQRARVDDPMAQFDVSSSSSSDGTERKKIYRGPPAPSNRYSVVLPGYRWDGVNRGNGFEAKVIESLRRSGKMK
jgi:pre-mRNA-splicing factor CWC26